MRAALLFVASVLSALAANGCAGGRYHGRHAWLGIALTDVDPSDDDDEPGPPLPFDVAVPEDAPLALRVSSTFGWTASTTVELTSGDGVVIAWQQTGDPRASAFVAGELSVRIDGPTTLPSVEWCGAIAGLSVKFDGGTDASVWNGGEGVVEVAGRDVAVRNVGSYRYGASHVCTDSSSGDRTTWLATRLP